MNRTPQQWQDFDASRLSYSTRRIAREDARADILELVTEVERLQAEVVRLRAYIERGVALLHPLTERPEVAEYRERALDTLTRRIALEGEPL